MATDDQENPTIIEPGTTPEIFATDIAHVGMLDGALVITLVSLRADVTTGKKKVERQKVVVGRLALTNRAAGELLNKLQGLAQRLNLLNKPTEGTPNQLRNQIDTPDFQGILALDTNTARVGSGDMADSIFSYSKADRHLALKLSTLLSSYGYTTRWDSQPTDKFRDKILQQIDEARADNSLWTKNRVKSDWVKAEAGRAKGHDKANTSEGFGSSLCPLKLYQCLRSFGEGFDRSEAAFG